MFLETLCRRNPEFIQSVVRLHQKGELRAITYVLDYDAIRENLVYMAEEASRLGLTIYPMTKQIGRNPAILDLIKDMKFGKKAMEEIENQIYQEADGFDRNSVPIMSVWMFFNVLTWYITHKAVSLNHRVDMEKRLRTAMVYLRGR